jgi:hypothetical protein
MKGNDEVIMQQYNRLMKEKAHHDMVIPHILNNAPLKWVINRSLVE